MPAAKKTKGAEPERQTLDLHGKEYETVASRVARFRWAHPISEGWAITTQLLTEPLAKACLVKASILMPTGETLSTGHAIEKWGGRGVNSTSALENAETSAIGRALAAAGWSGAEYASADEVAAAVSQQQQPRETWQPRQAPQRQQRAPQPQNGGEVRRVSTSHGEKLTSCCPQCGGDMWDNTDSPRRQEHHPVFKCTRRECDGAIWELDRDGNRTAAWGAVKQKLGELPGYEPEGYEGEPQSTDDPQAGEQPPPPDYDGEIPF